MEQSSYFLPMSCNNVNVLSIGAAVSADMGRGFSIDASVRLNGVMDGLSSGLIVFLNRPGARVDIDDKLGLGIPGFNLDLNLKYNYRERFFVSAGLGIVGQRKFSELALTPIVPSGGFSESLRMRRAELPASVDIGLELEYKVNSRLNIFLLGQNILNSKIYRFNHYPELGANILGGIKATFY